MAKEGVEAKPQPSIEAEKPQEAKAESKEQSLSDIGRQRAERAQVTITKGVEAVKGSIGKGLSFLKEKGMALLALDVAAARTGKAAGELIQKDAAKTLEHAQAVGKAVSETGKVIKGAVKEDWEQTKGDIKAAGVVVRAGAEATGKFAVDVGKGIAKGAVETGKTAIEVGVIAGTVGVEVGKFTAKKAGEGVEAVSSFAAKKIEQTMDSAQKKYQEINGAISKLEQSARGKINEVRDRFNGKVNKMRDDAIDAIADAINAGIDTKQNLQNAIDQGRKSVGVKLFEFVKRHNEQKLEALKDKVDKAQRKLSFSTSMIEVLSR